MQGPTEDNAFAMPGRKPTTSEVVEALYSGLGEPEMATWLSRSAHAIQACLGEGLGAVAHTYDIAGPPSRWSIALETTAEGPSELAAQVRTNFSILCRENPGFLHRCLHESGPACTYSEITGSDLSQLPSGSDVVVKRWGIVDQICLNAANPDDTGVVVAVNVGSRRQLVPAQRRRISMLAAHLAAAARLAPVQELKPAAIFNPDGRVAHMEQPHQPRTRLLREHVLAVERARTKSALRDSDDALRTWRALLAGEYTLLDRFESDGRRFVIAVSNPPGIRDPRGLTQREAAVAAWAARGHSDKLIAYELGIATKTVGVLVGRVLRKLQLRTRTGLPQALRTPEAVEVVNVNRDAQLLVLSNAQNPNRDALVKLTAAEAAVAQSAALGLSNEEIARTRQVAEKTIANQLASIYRKVGVDGRAGLAALLRA